MGITTSALREWLEYKYNGYSVEGDPVHGTYGLIWFLTAKSANTIPQKFAAKTVAPESITQESTKDDVTLLRREFRMWLALPSTANVLKAFGFDIATLSESTQNRSIELPVMRMPRMRGSLQEWVCKPTTAEVADRLIALAQALNGLQFLYDHGFEGHGDLKPSNLLYDDLREGFRLDQRTGWPSSIHPWRIRVADLGWADAWVDLGFSNKALRDYLSPERLEGAVVPIKSDMFSMGVVASELLQGHHPAENLKKVQRSDGKWKRWVESRERSLEEVQSHRVKAIIERCLDPSPDVRPDALEFLNEICTELKLTYDLDVAETLALWRSSGSGDASVAQHEHDAWAAAQSRRLGAAESRVSLEQISKKLQQTNVVDFESCESWVPLAESFVYLAANNPPEQDRIRRVASEYLVKILGTVNLSVMKQIPRRSDWPTLKEFERFSMTVARVADLAGITSTDSSEFRHELGPYARSALYHHWASEARLPEGKGLQVALEMISSAIAEAPDEPVNYYFRASWTDMSRVLRAALPQLVAPVPSSIDKIIDDLETAIRLDPDWSEPQQLLESVRGKQLS